MPKGSPVNLDFDFTFGDTLRGRAVGGPESYAASQGSPAQVTPSDLHTPSSAPTRLEQHQLNFESSRGQDPAGKWSLSTNIDRENLDETFEQSTFQGNLDGSSKAQDDDKLPSWSELKTKAGKERKRLPLACIACRRKKIKCSGEKPACKHCMRARVPCVYKVTTRKAAPRTDYMAMLDKRLKRMEDRVIKMIPKDDLPGLDVTGRSNVKPPLPGQPPKRERGTIMKRSAQEAFDAELGEWASPKQGQPHMAATIAPRGAREPENRLLTEGSESLPPKELQEHLAEVFFDCVYGQSYLLLHKPSFMRKLKAETVPPVLVLAVCAISARFSTHPLVSTEPAFLRGEQWATPARNIVEKRHFEPNITVLTCMLILGLHYFGTCEGGLSWSFGGQAMRLGYALQLHKELDHDPLGLAQAERAADSGQKAPDLPELSFVDREIRRRLMWACYLMDTFNSSGTERPSFLNEEYVEIQLPIEESQFQLEIPGLTEDLDGNVTRNGGSGGPITKVQSEARSNMGVGAYVVRAVVVWKRIIQYTNLGGQKKDPHPIWDSLSQFAALQRQISDLRSRIPEGLKYTPENLAKHDSERIANQFLFLHIVLAQTNLFLHRFAIPTAPNVHRSYPPNTPKSFLAKSATTVVESASTISRLLSDSMGHTLNVPFAGYCAYAAATVHVWGIFSEHPMLEASSKENLRHAYRYLMRMKRYWGMFHYMSESIKDIYRAFADASTKSSSPPSAKHRIGATDTSNVATAIDSIPMSVEPSRAVTPTDDADEAAPSEPGDKRMNLAIRKSGKPMLQYGDWFNKYPHGVNEKDWEVGHREHRGENQKGNEAVLSQQSDLQSVEAFFASLNPPRKAEPKSSLPDPRSRKVARKRGKIVTEKPSSVDRTQGHDNISALGHHADLQKTMRQEVEPQQNSARIPTSDNLPFGSSDIDIPMAEFESAAPLQSQSGMSFDILASPQDGRPGFSNPRFATNAGAAADHGRFDAGVIDFESPTDPTSTDRPGQINFNFNYTTALPQLDRQMVFGAYAGVDPSSSSNSAALNNMANLDFWANPWDPSGQAINIGAFPPLNESMDTQQESIAAQLGEGGVMGPTSVASQGYGPNVSAASNGTGGGSAWMLPFNIEPPNFPGFEDFSFFEDMDMGPDRAYETQTASSGHANAVEQNDSQNQDLS